MLVKELIKVMRPYLNVNITRQGDYSVKVLYMGSVDKLIDENLLSSVVKGFWIHNFESKTISMEIE